MKYWKGKQGTNKANQYGTMENDGHVPNSIIISKFQYDQHISSLPTVIDEKTEYMELLTDKEKIKFIAKKLNLIKEEK